VDESMKLPDIFTKFVECKASLVLNMLKDYVNCDVLQALNAHDFKKAIECLNPKNKNTEDNLISVLIDKYKREINVIDAKTSYTRELIYENPEAKEKDIVKLDTEKLKIEGIIDNIRTRVKNSTFCPICYNDYNNKSILDCCQNSFCFECLSKWVVNNKRCPMCNSVKCVKDILVTVDEDRVNADDEVVKDELLDKFNTAMKIIKEKPEGSFLILSSYDEPLLHLTPLLTSESVSYAYLKGNQYCINNTIQKFNNNDVKVLLINPQYYGCGLNLEHTSDIILFHKLESEMEKQIIGRAQRLGRKDNLKIR
jgi:SNF2 family DNA or RNA helicase